MVTKHVYAVAIGRYARVSDRAPGRDHADRRRLSRAPWPLIEEALDELGRQPEDIHDILVTHCHPDHAGGLAEIKRATGAKVWMHAADADMVERGQGLPALEGRPRTAQLVVRLPRGAAARPRRSSRSRWSTGCAPARPSRWRAASRPSTPPGTAPATSCSCGPATAGCSSPATRPTTSSGLNGPPIFEDAKLTAESLRKLANEKFRVACFAHGAPIVGNADAQFRARWRGVAALRLPARHMRSDELTRGPRGPLTVLCSARWASAGAMTRPAAHRGGQLLQRVHPRAHAPALHRRAGEVRGVPGRGDPAGVRRHRRVRRPGHEPRGHELLAGEPRGHRRLGGDHGPGSRAGRAGAHPQLRQGGARHGDGRGPAGPAGGAWSPAGRCWRAFTAAGGSRTRTCSRPWARTSGAASAPTSCDELEDAACPTCGSCAGLFTANSMSCLTECLGLALPGDGDHARRLLRAAGAGAADRRPGGGAGARRAGAPATS